MHLLMTAETVFRPPIGQNLCRSGQQALRSSMKELAMEMINNG